VAEEAPNLETTFLALTGNELHAGAEVADAASDSADASGRRHGRRGQRTGRGRQ
jgi:hypothetical protein